MFTVLEIAPRDERLHRPHHLHVAHVVDRVVAHRAGEHRQVLGLEVRARRGSSCARRCRRRSRRPASSCSRGWRSARGIVWLTINIVPPPTSFFTFASAEVGLDAGGVAVHHQADRAGGREHRWPASCARRTSRRARRRRPTPAARRRAARAARAPRRSWPPRRGACAARCSMCSRVLGVAGERAHAAGGAGAGGVGVAGHQRGDRRRPGPALVGVVGQAEGHQQGAEVGVAEAELAELPAVSRRSSRSGSRRCRRGSPAR